MSENKTDMRLRRLNKLREFNDHGIPGHVLYNELITLLIACIVDIHDTRDEGGKQ